MKKVIPDNKQNIYLYSDSVGLNFPIYRIEFDNSYSMANDTELLFKMKKNLKELIKECEKKIIIIDQTQININQKSLF